MLFCNSLIGGVLNYIFSEGVFIRILACWVIYIELLLLLRWILSFITKRKLDWLLAITILTLFDCDLVEWALLLTIALTINLQLTMLDKYLPDF
jgi:hypothetical protein